ncbi:MAG: hypothetical protein O2946_09225 [Planctomycetota bacterium]|nr:hypothetical protein [Planctomycetota bacterium]
MEPSSSSSPAVPRCRSVEFLGKGHATGRRLIFLHIPKTAGTAITSFLRQQFADDKVMPQLQANFHRSHPIWPLVARRSQLLGVGMHLDHDRVAALARGLVEEAPPFLLTVLREPRARLLSRYKEWRSTPDEHMQAARGHVQEAILTARTRSFSEFLHSDNPVVVSTLDNLQARLLAGLNLSRKLHADELLEHARANLASYDLVGTTSSCNDTLRVLADAYGWAEPVAELARVHQSQPVPDDILRTDDAAEERIAAYTALDQALWDDLHRGRLPPPPMSSTPAEDAAPQPSSQRSLAAELRLDQAAAEAPPPAAGRPTASTEAGDRGPGFSTVASIVERARPSRVFGVGRRKWFPSLDDDPLPLAADERVLFVLRFPAVSHQRSLILREAAIPTESLLAITEVDRSDPRLRAFVRQPGMQPYASLEGEGEHAVLTFAVGRYRRDHGSGPLDAAIETLERCQSTHPHAVQALHDTPASRTLAVLLLRLSLTAAVGLLADPASPHGIEALLGTLRPEDHDPLLPSVTEPTAPLAALWQRLGELLDRAPLPADHPLVAHLGTPAAEDQPLAGIAECYATVLSLLSDRASRVVQ